jgi:hypothetical protein
MAQLRNSPGKALRIRGAAEAQEFCLLFPQPSRRQFSFSRNHLHQVRSVDAKKPCRRSQAVLLDFYQKLFANCPLTPSLVIRDLIDPDDLFNDVWRNRDLSPCNEVERISGDPGNL